MPKKQKLLQLVENEACRDPEERHFDWIIGKKIVASATLHADGLLEYSGKLDCGVEKIGQDCEHVYAGNVLITTDS